MARCGIFPHNCGGIGRNRACQPVRAEVPRDVLRLHIRANSDAPRIRKQSWPSGMLS